MATATEDSKETEGMPEEQSTDDNGTVETPSSEEAVPISMGSFIEAIADHHAEDHIFGPTTAEGLHDLSSDDETETATSGCEDSARGIERKGSPLAKGLATLKERRAKVALRLKFRIEKVKRRAKQADAVKFQDKIMFSCGVLNFGLTCYMAGAHPSWVWQVYSLKFVCLLALRLYLYRKEKFGYFLLDFCYFANLVLLWYLWLAPSSVKLFRVVFSFSNGPLGLAVIAWRNSLVFHSLDKITSLFIHIEPVLVTYILSITTGPESRFKIAYPEEGVFEVLGDMIFSALLLYCLWQFGYWLKVQVLDREKIQKRNRSDTQLKYVTSFIYMREQKSAVGKFIRKAPHRRQPMAFAGMQLIYTVVTLSAAPLLYFFPSLHYLWLLFLVSFSTWNGSCFYFEVFSSRYEEQLKQLRLSAELADLATSTPQNST
mmetsp:Transcript_55604/g.118416  ORF Transcript_55604/g.118416 Transcript_55604/m.118416 type:complete len:430 (+) Transcript_55604:73-1362(+)